MLLSALISALNGATAKLLSDYIDTFEMVFFRNLIGMAIILYTLKHVKQNESLTPGTKACKHKSICGQRD